MGSMTGCSQRQVSMGRSRPRAVAVGYDPAFPAPRILFKARGHQVERLLALARERGLAVVREPELTQNLFLLPENSFIPEDYFEIMAKILSAVYTMAQEES